MSNTTTWTPATHQHMAPRERLAFTTIEIDRAPGISPGFTLHDLSPDINIVYGPNASGKSTTARVIQSLIWPHPSSLRGHRLAAEFDLGDRHWEITADAGQVTRTVDGEPADPPALAPIDDRMRYTLGLHDLLASENQPLAHAILKESSGGFDLEAVADAFGYDAVVPTRHEAARAVEMAQARVRDARRSDNEVAGQVRHLEVLRQREREALRAVADVDALQKALRLSSARAALASAKADVDAFPEVFARLSGDELERVNALNDEIDALNAREQELAHARDRAVAEQHATELVEKEVTEGVLQMLREGLDDLRRYEQERERLQRDLQSAYAERESHQRRLAAEMSDAQMSSLDANGIRELAEISRSYEDIRARRKARDEVELWIGGTQPPENLDTLRQGVEALTQRLQNPNRQEAGALVGRAQMAAYIGGALAIAAAIWLANFVNPLWLLFSVLGILVILFAWKYGVPDTTREAEAWEERYRALGLPEPASWTRQDIRQQLSALQSDLRRAEVEQEKAERWADLEQERADLDRAYLETEQRRARAVEQFGVAPDLKEESLRLLAENLGRWQAADALVRSKRARIDQLEEERAELVEGLNEELAVYGYEPDTTGTSFEAHVVDLEHRYRALQASRERELRIQEEIEGAVAAEIRRKMDARARIFAWAGVPDGDNAALKRLLDELPAYHEAKALVARREEAVREAFMALSLRPELRDMSADELQQRLDEAKGVAAGLDGIRSEMAAARTRISDAMRSREIEEALGRRDDALHALRDERTKIARSVIGATLVSTIQQETRDASMPIVFHRARELFSIITRGRYELQFEEGPPPAFSARDTSTGATLHLDQLSSGTRVQVLMAIRLAFVENVEAGPKLPVLLDETLGNSDELRAGAIIDAAIDISRNGRQVFYFTAQGDEVARWQARLESMPEDERPDVRVHDLAAIRQDAGFERLPIPEPKEVRDIREVPSPDGVDRDTYRALLRVPGVDLWADGSGQIHLWHLIDDPATLHRLLSQDVVTWGQLSTLERTGGMEALVRLGVDERTWASATARVRLIESAIGMWRIGHGRPVPLLDLAESGVVDELVLDEVGELLASVEGDGERLLEALRESEDPPITGKPLERLETWLIGEGYVPQGDPLPRQDIRARLIANASDDLRAGLVDGRDIDAVMELLPE